MQLASPIPPATFASVRVHLESALTAASNVASDTTVNTLRNLTDGVKAAKAAVADLQVVPQTPVIAQVTSDVVTGQQLLEQAVSVLVNDASADDTAIFTVQRLARDAANCFHDAFHELYRAGA